ncbi:glycoside hydrolase family 5 protein [Henriciella aquimarina]|uniref:glycoside hydrolase family 5 protein n=1 Tax=Henriciella aquimarina TaxID=545261 RepID=UPI001301FA83|nr:glycoside hydrolase family 5 protein [Henriciella aquimarina]
MRSLLLSALLLLAACAPAERAAHAEDRTHTAPDGPVERCVNLGGALEAPREGLWGYTVREDDMARIREAGFDTVRLPVKWSAHAETTKPYRIDPAFMARVKEVVGWAEAAGLKVIVDVHHYDALMADPDGHRTRLGAIWEQIAEGFEGAPDSVIFELINESRDRMTVRKTDAINRELLAIVRETHPDRWVIVGSAGWGSLDALLKSRPPEDDRMVLTFHTYDPYDFTHQGASFSDDPPPVGKRWGTRKDYDTMEYGANLAARFAVEQGHPILLGEFGVYEDVPLDQRVKWTRAMREMAEARNIGWCYWDFATTFKLYNQDREAWIGSLLSALIED